MIAAILNVREKGTGALATQIPITVGEAMMTGYIDHVVAEYDDTEWYVERFDILPITAGLAPIE